jgi:hypothetical protein
VGQSAAGQKVLAGLTMSVDGYITGPDDGPGAGLGIGGERLHYCDRIAVRDTPVLPAGPGTAGIVTLIAWRLLQDLAGLNGVQGGGHVGHRGPLADAETGEHSFAVLLLGQPCVDA